MVWITGEDSLIKLVDAYSASTLKNCCEFSAIVASYFLQKRLFRGINQYYTFQMILTGELYIFSITASGYFVYKKYGDEQSAYFAHAMQDRYKNDASQTIADFLAEYEPRITRTLVEPVIDGFSERYKMYELSLQIKSDNYKNMSGKLFTQILFDSFSKSNGYDCLLSLSNGDQEEVRRMFDSFGAEFQKDILAKLSSL